MKNGRGWGAASRDGSGAVLDPWRPGCGAASGRISRYPCTRAVADLASRPARRVCRGFKPERCGLDASISWISWDAAVPPGTSPPAAVCPQIRLADKDQQPKMDGTRHPKMRHIAAGGQEGMEALTARQAGRLRAKALKGGGRVGRQAGGGRQ